MRKLLISVLAIAAMILGACGKPADTSPSAPSAGSHIEGSITVSDVTAPASGMVQLIRESVGCCTVSDAENIASRLEKLGITEAVSIMSEEADGANRMLTVTTGDGKAYEVSIDKLNRVYAVMDKESGEYLFSITE